jgi:hypothetical protein
LLEGEAFKKPIIAFRVEGDNIIEAIKYDAGKVFINKTQYFEGVPETARNFYIGGYQPAQKWLKDRKGRVLKFEDIKHYQKIIASLCETDKLMKEKNEIWQAQ